MRTLKNHASVLLETDCGEFSVVLAIKPEPEAYQPYVTWVVDRDDNAFSGDYYTSLHDAIHDYEDRVGQETERSRMRKARNDAALLA